MEEKRLPNPGQTARISGTPGVTARRSHAASASCSFPLLWALVLTCRSFLYLAGSCLPGIRPVDPHESVQRLKFVLAEGSMSAERGQVSKSAPLVARRTVPDVLGRFP